MELSPGSFRTFVVGTSYQLGNLASSASSTIEARLGENYPLPSITNKEGKEVKRYNYGKVVCIFVGAVYAYVILLAFVGPERRGRNLNVEADTDMNEAVGGGHRHHHHQQHHDESQGSEEDEKAVRKEREAV